MEKTRHSFNLTKNSLLSFLQSWSALRIFDKHIKLSDVEMVKMAIYVLSQREIHDQVNIKIRYFSVLDSKSHKHSSKVK